MQKVWEAVEPMLAVFILAGIGWVVAEVIQFALRTVTRRVGEASSAQVFFTGVVRRGSRSVSAAIPTARTTTS